MAKGNHSAKGRPPSENPRTIRKSFRFNQSELETMENTAKTLNISNTDVVIQGIGLMSKKAERQSKIRCKGDI